MTSRDFAYWLQGLFELSDTKTLDEKQTDLIRRHLAMVFAHEIDPSHGPPEHQAELRKLHERPMTQPTIHNDEQSPEELAKTLEQQNANFRRIAREEALREVRRHTPIGELKLMC